jgi:hypothetical protein
MSENVFHWLTLAGGALGWGSSLYIWWRSVKTRRAEWLYSLYAKFYEDDHYKKTRILLDYHPKDEIEKLYKGLEEGCFPEKCEPLVDYLNFFEFIAGLQSMGQLTLDEVRMLFQYYLDIIRQHPPIVHFIETQGFEHLRKLLADIEVPKR